MICMDGWQALDPLSSNAILSVPSGSIEMTLITFHDQKNRSIRWFTVEVNMATST